MCKEKRPHVHAELIKAWADGEKIQFKCPSPTAFSKSSGEWIDTDVPEWLEYCEYRIKPEPSDTEKYGVEVGDVWQLSATEMCITVLKIFKGSGKRTTEVQSFGRGTFPIGRLKCLVFRRGVVNKL